MSAYALVTPARDEADNLRRLAGCVEAQTLAPTEWVIVDDGSVDGTLDVARALERRHEWVSVVAREAGPALTAARRDGRPRLAFGAGVAALRPAPEVVVKLDADVSLPPDHLEGLVCALAADPELGIVTGVRHELKRGAWRPQHLTGTSVEAQCRAYRWRCLQEISPSEARFYWDGIDVVQANVCGWRTETLEHLPFLHHREMGSRDAGRVRAWTLEGGGSHYMNYRPSYLVIRALFQARHDPAALAMIGGYAAAVLSGEPRHTDPDVRAYVRGQQSLRCLPARAREALGSPRSSPSARTRHSPA
jgi:glycosyltransferase involved in cell wall biosynthesis